MKILIPLFLLVSLPLFAMKPIAIMSASNDRQKSVCILSGTEDSRNPLHVKMEFFFEGDPAGSREAVIKSDYDLIAMSKELKGSEYSEVLNEEERSQYLISALLQDEDGNISSTPVHGVGYRNIESVSPLKEEFVSAIEALCLTI